jgi:hypothetical protein
MNLTLDRLLSATIVATPDHISASLTGEAVILNLKSGVYFGLNQTGAMIWNAIQEPKMLGEIRDTIETVCEVKPDDCQLDLVAFLQELHVHGLIQLSD